MKKIFLSFLMCAAVFTARDARAVQCPGFSVDASRAASGVFSICAGIGTLGIGAFLGLGAALDQTGSMAHLGLISGGFYIAALAALGVGANELCNSVGRSDSRSAMSLDASSCQLAILENEQECVFRLHSIDSWKNRAKYDLGKLNPHNKEYMSLLTPRSLVLIRQLFIEETQSWVIEVREGMMGRFLSVSVPVRLAEAKVVAERGMDGRLDIAIHVPFLTSCQTSESQEIAAIAA